MKDNLIIFQTYRHLIRFEVKSTSIKTSRVLCIIESVVPISFDI